MTPVALVTAVGTQVYWYDSQEEGLPRLDESYSSQLDVGGWGAVNVRAIVGSVVKSLSAAGISVHWRPEDEQLPHKFSLGARVEHVTQLSSTVRDRLADVSVQAQLIVSGHGEWRFLDVVSIGGGKLNALKYVRSQLQTSAKFEDLHTIAAGDSGNDIAMMEGTHRVIVVGNAQSELVEWYEALRPVERDRVYRTKGHCAAGLLEALQRWGLILKESPSY